MDERHATIVIGGGQAGLAMSYHLQRIGREHLILERARIAARWHDERWDSLRFQFPNWSLQLPSQPYEGDDPHRFSHRAEVAQFIEGYAQRIRAPIRCGTEVLFLEALPTGGYRLTTRDGCMHAAQVVIATGPYQLPQVPGFATGLPAQMFQIHARRYRNPAQLPRGAVLIVGAGSSGCQIAEELLADGRRVYLSVGRHRRIPRRYRGRDMLYWLFAIGSLEQTVETLADRRAPPPLLLTGADGGHTVDLRTLGSRGVVLLGKLQSIRSSKLVFDDHLELVLAAGDQFYCEFKRSVDEYIAKAGLDLPDERDDDRQAIAQTSSPVELDLASVSAVVWCTGYRLDFGWVNAPVLDAYGAPLQKRGVTASPGLYFLGLQWMHNFASATLFGVGEDAAYIAKHMV